MLTTSFFNYRIILTLIISALCGLALVLLFPVFNTHPQIMLALPAAGVFFLMLVALPRLTFILIFLVRPLLDNSLELTRINIAGQSIGFGAVLNLVIIFLAFFLFFYEGNVPRKNPVVRSWMIFLLAMFIAVVDSSNIGRAVRIYANYLSYFGMFLIPFFIIKSKNDLHFWARTFAWSFVLPVLYANIDLLSGGQFYPDAGMRIRGSFSHPNVLAFYLCLGITYYFLLLRSNIVAINRKILILFLVNMVFLLIATKTRNAWIAIFGMFFIFGLLKDKRALLVLMLIIPFSMLIPTVRDRVVTVTGGKSDLDYKGINSFEWRIQMWKSSLPLIAQRPLQGYGLATFVPMSESFSVGGKNAAHNMYVETLFESGLIGFTGLCALLFTPLIMFSRHMTRVNREQSVIWAIIVSYLISYNIICFADNLSYYLVFNWYVWFFIGLMMVAKRYFEPSVPNGKIGLN